MGFYTYDLRTGAQIGPVLGTSTIVSLSAGVVFGAGGVAPPSLVPTPVPLPAGPSGASAVYAGTSRGRIYGSIDAGATWQEADTGLSTASSAVVTALAIAPGTGESIYAGTFTEGIFTSTDGGGHWHNVNGGNLALATANILALAVDPHNGRIVYLVTDKGSVYRSDNGGQTWSNLWTDPRADQGIDTLILDGSRSSILFAAGEDGIFRSTNEGVQWQQVDADDVSALTVDPTNPDIAYAGGSQETPPNHRRRHNLARSARVSCGQFR